MKKTDFIKSISGILLSSLIVASCSTKKTETPVPNNPYATTKNTVINVLDSVKGELAEPNASVIYSLKGNGKGISVRCYDQTYMSSDTSYADVAVYIATSKAKLNANIFVDTLYPSKTVFTSDNVGIQDSIYIKIASDTRSELNSKVGRYILKVVQNTMLIESADATSLMVDASSFTLVELTTKGAKYYEKYYKTAVTPGNTYYLQFFTADNDTVIRTDKLSTFYCDFWDKDGITSHPGTSDISNIGIINDNSTLLHKYVKYTIPEGQPFLYIRCYNTTTGTNRIKLFSTKP